PPVVAWVFSPAAASALRRDVAERLRGGSAGEPAGAGVSTHDLLDAAYDPVERRCAALGLRNAPGSRVSVIRVPVAPLAGDGFLGTSREAALSGMDLSCHLSTAAPSERGPLESLALGVPAVVPAALSGLARLAGNLWWTWDSEAQALFEDLSPRAWRAARRSPVRMLRAVSAGGLPAAAHDPAYVRRIEGVVARFDAYLSRPRGKGQGLVAYFSAEFGIHEALPIYSGGLGILAGDHLKSASDVGLPLVGVGLLYRRGRVR